MRHPARSRGAFSIGSLRWAISGDVTRSHETRIVRALLSYDNEGKVGARCAPYDISCLCFYLIIEGYCYRFHAETLPLAINCELQPLRSLRELVFWISIQLFSVQVNLSMQSAQLRHGVNTIHMAQQDRRKNEALTKGRCVLYGTVTRENLCATILSPLLPLHRPIVHKLRSNFKLY